MGLKKGATNNPKGRPAGIPNVLTRELRGLLKSVLTKEIEKVPEHLNKLEPKDRLELLIKIFPYVLPKIETVEMDEGEPWYLNITE